MKKNLLLLFVITLFLTGSVFAQIEINANTYTFTKSSLNVTTLTGPVTLIASGSDNVASPVTDIGFTFWFAGTPYTQFSVNENGLMTLGSTQISAIDVTNLMASNTTLPKIAPYWDDLATGTNGSVVYSLTGTAPYRILIVQWNVTIPKNTTGAANSVFQVQLTETTGLIAYRFGFPGPVANTNQFSIGIGKANNDFASLTTIATTTTGAVNATCAYGIANDANNSLIFYYSAFSFSPDKTAPTLAATPVIPNSFGTANRTLLKTIGDAKTGIPTSGSSVPKIYFKKGLAGTYVSTPGVLQSGTATSGSWLFTVDHSLLGGVTDGDKIYYYVVAQDQANTTGVPNIASYPTGALGTDVNTISTHPATPSFYVIGASLSGIKTVGTGGDYPSLTLAGGIFEQINAGQLSGNLTINIISDLAGETGSNALNAWANGAGGPFTVTINPVGNRTITSTGPILLNGTQSATINGLNDGTNSLIINSSGGAISLTGASNNLITRATLKGSGSSGGGVIVFTNTSTPCSNNTISYCSITSSNPASPSYHGIFYTGNASTGTGNIIDNNIMTNFSYFAIHKGYTTTSLYTNFTISNNDIYNTVAVSERHYYQGICLESTSGNSSIFNNKIHDLLVIFNTMSGNGISAIVTTNTASDVTKIFNNEIYLDATVNHPLQSWTGIIANNAGTSYVDYNSIYIGGSSTNSSFARGIYKSATTGTSYVRNNVAYISRTGSVNSAFSIAGPATQSNNYSGNPGFTSPTNLMPDATNPNSNFLDAHGIPVTTTSLDKLGNPRNATTPDIGAYEFVPLCTNPTAAGTIGADLTGCAPFVSGTINSTGLPTGHTGTLDYKWQSSVTTVVDTWVDIASNTESYNPGTVSVTTKYRRVARVNCKGDWLGAVVSNVVVMTVNPLPLVTTANTATICSGTGPNISLTASVPSTFTRVVGTVTGGVTGASNGSGAVINQILTNVGPVSGTVEYIVTPTSVTGLCAGHAYIITVTVNPIKPVSVSISASQNPVCSGTLVNYAAFPTNGGTLPSFVWKVNGMAQGTTNTFSYTPVDGHVVTCELTPGNDVVCPSVAMDVSNEILMAISPTVTPTIAIGTTTGSVCAGGSLNFTATVTNGGITPLYVWKVNGTTKGTNSPVFTYTASDYLTQTIDVVTCELNSTSPCASANPVPSNQVNITVNPYPVSNAITGEAIPCAGSMAVAYGITTDNSVTASYAWSYSGLGATLSAGSGSAITINFASNATNGILAVVETNSATGCSTVNTQALTINQCFITLNLKLFFEGLYVGGGTMNQAWNAFGSQYGPGIADVVSVDLHDPVNFATVHYTLNNVEISTSGTSTLLIPGTYNGTYYLSFHHRNSIETITALQVSLGTPVVNYDFTTAATQAYGSNMKQMPDGTWALYGGDANGDGAIDGLDLISVENEAAAFNTGYILSDTNGDGAVDGFDLILIENNATGFVQVITP